MGSSESKVQMEEWNAGTLDRLRELDDLHDVVFKVLRLIYVNTIEVLE